MNRTATLSVLIIALLLCTFLSGCAAKQTKLFKDNSLEGWKLFIPDPAVDVNKVWSIKDGVVRCTGNPAGYMRTIDDYSNYKLHVEWRWAANPGNSGVLLHMSEPDKVWPKSIEAQLMSSNAGDFYLIGGTEIKEHEGMQGTRVQKLKDSSENPPGQWNIYDITCLGGTIELLVNGVLQNKGTEASVTSGKICLQSEGAPIEFRNVYIEPLK